MRRIWWATSDSNRDASGFESDRYANSHQLPLAASVGFEPTCRLLDHLFSKQGHLTALPTRLDTKSVAGILFYAIIHLCRYPESSALWLASSCLRCRLSRTGIIYTV